MYKINSFSLHNFLLIIILFLCEVICPQAIRDNFRIFPSNSTQTEVFITTHPHNPSFMFASANTIIFQPSYFVSEGVYVTTDGGTTWFGSDTCKGANINFHGGDPGIAIDKDGVLHITRKARFPLQGLFAHYSTDYGATWSDQYPITTEFLERAAVTTDGFSQSQFFGRTYAAWVKLSPPFALYSSYTTNNGASWSSPVQVNNPTQRCAGGEAVVYRSGKIYTCWAGVDPNAPFSEKFIGFASSSDGGNTWTVNENIFPTQGIRGLLSQKQNIRVDGLPRMEVDNTGGERDGWIYIVTTQKNLSPAGTDPDIILNRSTDGGLTWSQGIRVNQDPLNNGKIQYFPAIHIDETGGVNVIFYDDRNTTSDSTGVFLARSVDGGNTWIEYEISDHNFRPSAIGGLGQGYQGDNIGLTSSGKTLWPVWMDNSSGIYQVWAAPIDISVLDAEEQNLPPSDFKLNQNYPNPFNPSTTLSFIVGQRSFVSLKVYDVLGNEVALLINEEKLPGVYEINFNASGLSSGIYFYKLTAGSFTETKKMVLLR